MNDQAALTKPSKDIFALLDSSQFKERLAAALPNRAIQAGVLTPGRLVQLARTMIQGSAALARCTPLSIMACVVESAQLGLELDKVLGHAYLVPFKDECTLIVGYRGFIHLAYQSGTVNSISAEIVRKTDKFSYQLGTKRELIHVPNGIPKDDSEANWKGAYAVVEFIHGGTSFEYMETAEIELHRNRSRSWQAYKHDGKPTPWVTDAGPMWRKTPIRKLGKRMPMSTTDKRAEFLRAVMLDEYSERRGLLVPTLHGFEVNENPPAPDDPDPISQTQEADATDKSSAVRDVIEVKTTQKTVVGEASKTTKPGKKISAQPTTQSTTQATQATAQPTAQGPPKSKIPPPVDRFVDDAEKALADSTINVAQQTAIYNAGFDVGWTVDEIRKHLKTRYKVNSINQIRNSQYADLMRSLKDPT